MFLDTKTAAEARLGLKQRPERETELKGKSSLRTQSDELKEMMGYPGAVTLTIIRGDVYMLALNVHQRLIWTTELAPGSLTSPHISNAGYALLLFPSLNEAFELKFTDVMGHKLGRTNMKLEAIDKIAREAEEFNANLLLRLSKERRQQESYKSISPDFLDFR